LHFSITVYHETSTCRIGDVVDPELRVIGMKNLRIADASVMPNVISGNTYAPSIMIGEKAAEMIALEHGVKLAEFVGSLSHIRPARAKVVEAFGLVVRRPLATWVPAIARMARPGRRWRQLRVHRTAELAHANRRSLPTAHHLISRPEDLPLSD
jgi:hypothetical protein